MTPIRGQRRKPTETNDVARPKSARGEMVLPKPEDLAALRKELDRTPLSTTAVLYNWNEAVDVLAYVYKEPCTPLSTTAVLNWNEAVDVLVAYVYKEPPIAKVRPAPDDPHMLFMYDEDGDVVGIEVFGPLKLHRGFWDKHPNRAHSPATEQLFEAVDGWLTAHGVVA